MLRAQAHLPKRAVIACRNAFWLILLKYIEDNRHKPNRGLHRHYLPMPFHSPCFAPEFFFDKTILDVIPGAMGSRVVADQWGCDVPVRGSEYQSFHVDYHRPLFEEVDLSLPPYLLVVSFGLVDIGPKLGPIEIAVGTHRMAREVAMRSVETDESDVHLFCWRSATCLFGTHGHCIAAHPTQPIRRERSQPFVMCAAGTLTTAGTLMQSRTLFGNC
jgi:hypothetical protein